MLRRRSTGARLEQAPAFHQRHDRQHLRARAELEDREQVGQVVAQHVPGDRDRVLAAAGALERESRRLRRRRGSRSGRSSVSSSSSAGRTLRSTSASCARVSSSQNTAGVPVSLARDNGEPHPILDRARPWSGTCARCRRRRPRAPSASAPASSTTRTVPGAGDLERLVVRPVLLGGLCHQPDVGRAAHRRRVERAVLAAVVDGLGVQLGVRVIRDHELRVLLARLAHSTSGPTSGSPPASTRR